MRVQKIDIEICHCGLSAILPKKKDSRQAGMTVVFQTYALLSNEGKRHKREVNDMKNRITVSLNLTVDLKINEGVDISEIKEIINSLECNCVDTTGKARVMGVDIIDRSLIIEKDDEPDAE